MRRIIQIYSIPVALLIVRVIFLFINLSENERYLIRSIFVSESSIENEGDVENCSLSKEIDLSYENPTTLIRANLSFDKRWIKYLCNFGLLERSGKANATPGVQPQSHPPFVTAFSENHFLDGLQFLIHINAALVKENTTNFTVILYDLGLRRPRVEQIRRSFGHFVQIRQFPFHHYPPYVANLKQYRWKPLIVADVLRTHESFWWMDASIRIRSLRNLTEYYDGLRSRTKQQRPFDLVFQFSAGHSIYATTTSGMYDYFPIDRNRTIEVEMYAAYIFLVLERSDALLDRVVRWWVLCALEEACMAPRGHSLFCAWLLEPRGEIGSFAYCHRYDQSALNILMANENQYTAQKYVMPTNAIWIEKLQ